MEGRRRFDLDPETKAEIEAMANEQAASFHALVTSILDDEHELLHLSVETLLREGTVTIARPQGVVRVTVTNPGTDDAVVRGEYESLAGPYGNSEIPLRLIPSSRLEQTLCRHLAAWIGNLILTTHQAAEHGFG